MIAQPPKLDVYDNTLKPGEIRHIGITGEKLWVTECDFQLMVKFGESAEIPLDLGFGTLLPFERITLRNPSASNSCRIQFMYGTAEFRDSRFNIVTTRANQFVQFAEAATFLAVTDAKTSGSAAYPVSLAASGYVLLSGNRWKPGSTSSQAGRRKVAYISNNDPLSVLEVRATTPTDWKTSLVTTTNGGLVALVQPKTTLPLFVDDDLAVVNGTGSAIAMAVSEAFYLY